MENSRMFDKEIEESNDHSINFEYKSYLTHEIVNTKTNLLLYVIEKGVNPYVYYLMNKVNDIITLPSLYLKNLKQAEDFMRDKFEKTYHTYKGCIQHNNENYLLYEINLSESEIIPIYKNDSWWKVMPFEIIYSKKVIQYKVDSLCSHFFMKHPNLLYLFSKDYKYEVPIVAYIGSGESQLNNYILLEENYKNGKYGKGFYFTSLEEAYFNSLYDNLEPTDTILKLLNNNYINNFTPILDRIVNLKNNKLYLNNIFIGDLPSNCGANEFKLHSYNEDFIYLSSSKSLKKCKNKRNEYIKRKENGCILKFILFLKNSKVVTHKKGSNYDSYCSGKMKKDWFPTYMTKYSTFECISYHIIDKNNTIDIEFMERKNKSVEIHIK
jgi:hypothetical protein